MRQTNESAIEEVPSAHVADGVGVQLDAENEICTFTFVDSEKHKFTLTCEPKGLPLIFVMVSNLMMNWHKAKPDKGIFFHRVMEGLVSSSDEMRGSVVIQFDHGMGFSVENETALKLANLIEQHVKNGMTDAEWRAWLKKKAPMIVQPRKSIIRP